MTTAPFATLVQAHERGTQRAHGAVLGEGAI